jgi:hypothetical protein
MTDIEKVVSKVEEAAAIADAALKDAVGGIRDHNQYRPTGVVNGVVPGHSEDAHTQGVVPNHPDQQDNR